MSSRWVRDASGLIACVLMTLSCAVPMRGPAALPQEAHFTLLQINDVYKIEGLQKGQIGGLARVRTLRRQLEGEGKPVLMFLAGDFLYPSVMSKFLNAQPMIKVLNLMDGSPAAFDDRFIVTFGNHEFDTPDAGILLGRMAQSDFEWVSSNVRYRTSPEAAGTSFAARLKNDHDVLIRDVAGVKVGIFGLTVDARPQEYVEYAYTPEERRSAVRDALKELRKDGAQFIIALTHQDLAEDERLAADFPEIDLIIGGHEHFYIKRKVGHTWIMKADSDAQSAIVYDVGVSSGGQISAVPRRVALDDHVAKDSVVDNEVTRDLRDLGKVIKAQTGRDALEEIGRTKNLLEGIEPAVRGRETALGNFLADVIRARLKTDIAFVNGGSIRINDNIPPGGLTLYDLEGVFYYDNQLVACEITGAELLDVLRNAVSKVHLGDGRFLQVSGLRFRYHTEGTPENPSHRIDAGDVEVKPQGSRNFIPLDVRRKYSLGTTDFIWGSGYLDGYALFSKGKNGTSPPRIRTETEIGFRKAVEEAIAALPDKTITTGIEGRITAIEGP